MKIGTYQGTFVTCPALQIAENRFLKIKSELSLWLLVEDFQRSQDGELIIFGEPSNGFQPRGEPVDVAPEILEEVGLAPKPKVKPKSKAEEKQTRMVI